MSDRETTLLKTPPRLLLGVAFLFWGAMHGQAVPALVGAIAMEGRHWTNLRWEFGVKGFARSWQLSILILVVSAISLLRVEDLNSTDFLGLLSWLPFIMLPLALSQQYSRAEGVPTVTFSFIARRKMVRDRRAGRPVELVSVCLGYPFFILVLISSGMGVGSLGPPGADEWRYAIGVLILLGWAFLSLDDNRTRPVAWTFAYAAATTMAVLMLWGLASAYQYFLKEAGSSVGRNLSPTEAQTKLGQIHDLQLSPQIVWRYRQEKGTAPRLLKMASYNVPLRDFWKAGLRSINLCEQIDEEREAGGDFEALLSEKEDVFVYWRRGRESGDFHHVGVLTGLVSEQSLVPHPAGCSRFEEVPAEQLAVNSNGAFQMNGVNRAAMAVRLFSDRRDPAIELDPTSTDLIYLESEAPGLERFLNEIGFSPPEDEAVRPQSPRRYVMDDKGPPSVTGDQILEIEARISQVFQTEFTYSTFLESNDRTTPVTTFLRDLKTGHCEYFASATAMLLRRMGVPCRYVVGFAVQEKNGENKWVLRGQHAHAWVEAYVGGSWMNEGSDEEPVWRCRGGEWIAVDLTPPDWSSSMNSHPWSQAFSDAFQWLKANLILWVANPGVASGMKLVFGVVLVGGLAFLIYRLFKTRDRKGRREKRSWAGRASGGILDDLEVWLGKKVGPRPAGMPLASWLRRHLPDGGGDLVEFYERWTFRESGAPDEKVREKIRAVKSRWRQHQKTPEA